MKRIFIISGLITICNISYADIASTTYVDSVVDSLPAVAKTGSYDDLSNKPTNLSSFTNDSGYITTSYHDSTKQDKLPTGPSGGRYNLVWNGNTGNFVFELVPHSQCPNGQYYLGFSQCIDPDPNGTDYGFMNDSTGESGAWTKNTATYGLTTDQTWSVTFSYGIVKGIASCNSTPGTYAQSTNQNFNQTDKGQYCWCKMTFPAVSRWVFYIDRASAAACAFYCADHCGDGFRVYSGFRSAMFGSVGN
ncbi:MAG: hypothetical protein MJ170_00515 [Alphaproteobacteria bacterium]|nr:hypothetical protein [Alphaproteobacteria bacterium]